MFKNSISYINLADYVYILFISSSSLRYLLSPAVQKADSDLIQKLNWKELEKIAAFPEVNDDAKVLHIPGGGITKLLFTER